MIKSFLYTILFSTLLTSTACNKDVTAAPEFVAPTEKDSFVSAELLTTVPKELLQQMAASEGYGAYQKQVKYSVSVYKMVYTTTYQGKEIKASGLVCVPQHMATPAPVISAQHGTIFRETDAPTRFQNLSGFELFAAAGYITLVPDYIGFGESKDIFHPYYDQKHSALAVVDMIKAGRSFYKRESIPAADKLFLVGYSEGGYVTLAAQKEIETNPVHKLKVTASAAGAGGYDLVSMLGNVASGTPYTYPAYLVYVLQSYNKTNSWHRPLQELFQEPYASKISGLFNGQNGGSAINNALTTNPEKLFAPNFYKALQEKDKELVLKQALKNNSFYDWVPQAPTRLYHGTTDDIVPFANSKLIYERFKAEGAKQLEFMPIQGKGHGSAFVPMLHSIVPWIQSL